MSLHRTATLASGERVELHTSGHASPPDRSGMQPATPSLWVLRRCWWWRCTRSSMHTVRDLEQCDTWGEVLAFDVVASVPVLALCTLPDTGDQP